MFKNSYKIRLSICLIAILAFSSCTNRGQSEDPKLLEKARSIHNRVITLDTHIDINVKNFTDRLHAEAIHASRPAQNGRRRA